MVTPNENTNAGYLHLSPNPAKNEIICKIASLGKSEVILEILNDTGEKKFSKKLSLASGYNDIKVNITSFSKGVYRVMVTSSNGKILANKPLIVKK
jgi:hypothetical protein